MKRSKLIAISLALGTLILAAIVPSKAVIKLPSITVSSGIVTGAGSRPITK